jgi:hypothetical protein
MAENDATKSASMVSEDSREQSDIPVIPEGFTALRAPSGQTFLIPTFLAGATCFAYHRENERNEISPDTAAGGVSLSFLAAYVYSWRHSFLIIDIGHSHIGIGAASLSIFRKAC